MPEHSGDRPATGGGQTPDSTGTNPRLDGFEEMWRGIGEVGRSASSGGYNRSPFTPAESELRQWFVEQATARRLDVEADGNGNLLAWQGRELPGEAVLVGSHLDSVLDGGAYDGPLGVVSAFAALDLLAARGVEPARPIAVAAFCEEEGSRFGLACLGSRLATGATSPAAAQELSDRDSVPFLDAMAAAGVEPGLGRAAWIDRVGCFVELHVEQGKGLVELARPVGTASAIWPHGRYRFDFTGEANHAGSTRMEDRRDPMLTHAMTVLAANKQARLAGQRATFGRVEVFPNSTNAVPSRVTGWLDARADSTEELDAMIATVERLGRERAARDGTSLSVVTESASGAVEFDATLTTRIGAGLPSLPSLAGHDAGILAAAGIPTAMLFVRNPTGVSHSPAEYAATADCLAGVEALTGALAELTQAELTQAELTQAELTRGGRVW